MPEPSSVASPAANGPPLRSVVPLAGEPSPTRSTVASQEAQTSARPSPARASLAELLAALSVALDVTEGLPRGHASRTALIAGRVAATWAVDSATERDLVIASFLKDAGCSSNAAAVASIFGKDDLAIKARYLLTDRSLLDRARFAIGVLPATEPLPTRLRRLIRLAIQGTQLQRAVEQLRCERGAAIARQMGFGEAVAGAVQDVHEHWDGKGQPMGRRGEEISPLARVVAACAGLDALWQAHGKGAARRTLRRRRGTWYEPVVVDTLLALIDAHELDWIQALAPGQLQVAVHALLGSTTAAETEIDRVALGFAEIIDSKSPYTGRHSRRTSTIARRLAGQMGLGQSEVVDVARAGLLHDIGKLGIPNTILDKAEPLTPQEWEVIRRHPLLSWDILSLIPSFEEVADMAASHHERLDGTGYFRGRAGEALSLGARIVAVADVFEALTAHRPYRSALPAEEALAVMRTMVGDHLAAEVVGALPDVLPDLTETEVPILLTDPPDQAQRV
jgi:HD-GYP domain-containing protein (c-di-GMP phosphodiesterase class II)